MFLNLTLASEHTSPIIASCIQPLLCESKVDYYKMPEDLSVTRQKVM
jgi:hypothetical protein